MSSVQPNNVFKNNLFIVSVIVQSNCLAVFTSNVQCVRLGAGRYTQGGDAPDQWRDPPNAATVCSTQWQSPASAGWLSWTVDVDRPSVEGPPKQHNRPDSSPGCLGAKCQVRWTWCSHGADTPVCSFIIRHEPQPLWVRRFQIRLRSSDVKCPIITKYFVNKTDKQNFQKTLTKCQWRQLWCH